MSREIHQPFLVNTNTNMTIEVLMIIVLKMIITMVIQIVMITGRIMKMVVVLTKMMIAYLVFFGEE